MKYKRRKIKLTCSFPSSVLFSGFSVAFSAAVDEFSLFVSCRHQVSPFFDSFPQLFALFNVGPTGLSSAKDIKIVAFFENHNTFFLLNIMKVLHDCYSKQSSNFLLTFLCKSISNFANHSTFFSCKISRQAKSQGKMQNKRRLVNRRAAIVEKK